MTQARGDMCTGFWCGNLKQRDHSEDYAETGGLYKNGSSGNGLEGHGLD